MRPYSKHNPKVNSLMAKLAKCYGKGTPAVEGIFDSMSPLFFSSFSSSLLPLSLSFSSLSCVTEESSDVREDEVEGQQSTSEPTFLSQDEVV